MTDTRRKLKIGDRVAAEGTITLLTPGDDGHTRMTVLFNAVLAPLTFDVGWASQQADEFQVGDCVRLVGRLNRINHGREPRWDTGSVKFDGYAHATTLLISDLDKI